MKNFILLLSLIVLCLSVAAQKKADTTKLIPFHQGELNLVQNNIQQIYQKIHGVHIDAKLRDSIDNMLLPIYNFIDRRRITTLADTTKKKNNEHDSKPGH